MTRLLCATLALAMMSGPPASRAETYKLDASKLRSLRSKDRPRLTFSWVGKLRSHIDACWQRPDGITTTDAIEVRISFELNPNGSLARGPTLIEASPHRLGAAFAESAIAAIKRCQPYSFLPADEYTGGWDKLDMTFSTDAATRAPSRLKSSPTFHFDAKEVRKTLEQRLKERDTKGGTQ